MRILLVTDAWTPQINGVVVTLRNTVAWLRRWGHEVEVLSPEGFRTMPMPTYPEIPLAVVLYGANILLITLVSLGMMLYALKSKDIDTDEVTPRMTKQATIRQVLTPLCTLLGML